MCNIVLIGWTIFAIVFFSFPPVLPVTKDNMNYVSVVLVGYFIYTVLYWKFKGVKEFNSLEDDGEVEDIHDNESYNSESNSPVEYMHDDSFENTSENNGEIIQIDEFITSKK